MKKLLSVFLPLCLVMAMVFAMATTVSAEEKPQNTVNLTVGDNIVSHYYIDTNYYKAQGCDTMKYTYNGTSNQEDYTEVTQEVSLADVTGAEYEITAVQAAAQVAEPTEITIYKGGAVFDTISYSTKTYCDKIIEMNDETLIMISGRPVKLTTLCKSIIAYAKAAQGIFPEYMSKPGAVKITDDYSDDLGLDSVSYMPNIQISQGSNVRFKRANFICASSAGMRFYYTGSVSGDPVVEGPAGITWSKGSGYIQISGIKPVFFDEAVTVSLGDATISMNVLDYCGTVLNNASAAETQQALARSLLIHNEAADEYFVKHSLLPVAAKAATCTEAGYEAYYRCADCGQLCSDADGNNEISEPVSIPALGHIEVADAAVEATCTTAGKTAGSHCSRCNAVLTAQTEVAALGHAEVTDAAVPATCTETGLTAGSHCSRCNTVLTAQTEVAALGHSYGDWAVTTDAVAATCTATGKTAVETKTCSRCGDKQTRGGETTDALGHVEVADAAVAPTCTATGLTAGSHCSRCSIVLTAQTEVAALGHNYGTPTWTWTGNDTDGYTKAVAAFTCTRDASHKTSATDNSIDYTVTTEPDIGAAGVGTYTATVTVGGNNYSDTKNVALPALVAATFTHADNLANVDTYLYRAGNGNNIKLGTLFKVAEGSPNSSKVNVTVTAVSSANATAAGTVTKNSTDWTQGTVKFTGEGPVKVSIQEGSGTAYDLYLEVVPGNNYVEGASLSGTPGNVVLLGDVYIPYVNHSGAKTATLTFSGKNLYGNGFTIDATTSGIETMTHGIICLTNAKFDNAVVVGPTFDTYVGTFGNDKFSSVIWVYSGTDTVISNCRVTGASSPVRIMGDTTVKNTILSGGIFANLEQRSSVLHLDNVTTVNTQNGLGIVVQNGTDASAKLYIDGPLTQHNFISENATMSNDNATTLRNTMFGSKYSKYQFTSGGTKYMNCGIVSMSSSFGAANIIDNRSDKRNYSGMTATISAGLTSFDGYLYTMENTDASMLETSYTEPAYTPSTQSYYEPAFSWAVPSGDNVPAGGDAHCYKDSNGVLQIQFTTGGSKTLSVASLPTVKKYGKKVVATSVTCEKDSGAAVTVSGGNVTFSEKGEYILTYTYTDDLIFDQNGVDSSATATYTKTIKVNVAVKKAAPNAVITVSQTNGTMIWGTAGTSWDRDYQPAAQIFDYMTITDYDDNGNAYTVLDGNNQAAFLSSIASVTADSDNKTGFTIKLADGTQIVCKCGAPYNSGTLAFKKYNNKFLMCGSVTYNNPTAATWNVTSYTYTGRNGVAVTYGKRGFTSTTDSTNYSLSNLSTNKFLMYDAQGGTVSPSYASTSPATLPTPEREGYTFQNWNTKADGTGTASAAGSSKSFSSTTTLYAIWAKNVMVSFNGSGGSTPTSISGGAGTTGTLPASTRSNYWLEGWYTEDFGQGTKVGGAGASFTFPAEDTTYYANWSPNYIVAYDANGGTVSLAYDTYAGTALTLPTPTNGAKTFEGWYTEAEGGTKVGTAGDSYIPTANIQLFAQWSENILVTFDGNGGTADTNSDTYDHVNPITLPSATWAGHQFNGWYTEATGGTKVGDAGANYAPTEPTTLHAQWTAYTVSFDGNGATNPSDLSAGSDGTVTLPTPSRTGYSFNGWYSATSGGTKYGNGGASYTPTGNIIMHAHWNVQSYTLSASTSESTTVFKNTSGTTITSAAYNSVVQFTVGYNQTESQTFSISPSVTYYTDAACSSSTTSKAAGTYYFKMPANNVTVTSSSKAASSGCVTGDTLITLADGSQKRVDQLTGEEMLLVWNLETGAYDAAPMVFIDSDPQADYTVMHACFSDGSEVKIVSEHGFFDLDLGEYVYINEETMSDYIGHRFVKQADLDENEWDIVTLEDVWAQTENVKVYSPTTAVHLGYYTNGMLSMPGGIAGMFNIFDVDTATMKYDAEKMAADIEQYGLFTYEDFADIIPENAYYAFNGAWLKVAIEKGNITWDYIEYLAERYSVYF